nr:olfactory receptor 91 [Tropidothorax elegans]
MSFIMGRTAYMTFKNDPSSAFECVHFMLFLGILMAMSIAFRFQYDKMESLYRNIGTDIFDYEGTLDHDTSMEMQKVRELSRNQKLLFSKIFKLVVLGAYSSITYLRPVARYLLKEHLQGTPDDGMHRLMVVPCWLPFNKYNPWSNLVLYTAQWMVATCSLGSAIGHNLFFLTTCEDLAVAFLTLGLGFRRLRRRAAALPRSTSWQGALHRCLVQSIRHHQFVIRVVKDFEDLMYYPALIFVAGSATLICMSAFLFVNNAVPIVTKVCFALFLLAELLALSIYCYYGEKIRTYSREIFYDLYEGEWVEDIQFLKSYFLIIQIRAMNGIDLCPGGVMTLNLETNSNVLSTAFSYFNLMNAVN